MHNCYDDPIRVAIMAERSGDSQRGGTEGVEKAHLWEGGGAEVLISVYKCVSPYLCECVEYLFSVSTKNKRNTSWAHNFSAPCCVLEQWTGRTDISALLGSWVFSLQVHGRGTVSRGCCPVSDQQTDRKGGRVAGCPSESIIPNEMRSDQRLLVAARQHRTSMWLWMIPDCCTEPHYIYRARLCGSSLLMTFAPWINCSDGSSGWFTALIRMHTPPDTPEDTSLDIWMNALAEPELKPELKTCRGGTRGCSTCRQIMISLWWRNRALQYLLLRQGSRQIDISNPAPL